MLTLYNRLFSELEQQAPKYAVWKNTQELSDALMGFGDIDLYVYPGSRPAFMAVLRKLRFVCLRSHKAFPCVEHFYGYDENSGKFTHIHCYFRMVTGESHIKQYVVPIEPFLDEYPAVMSAEGIRTLHPVLQKKLNIFRRKIKLSCLPGALLFFRERRGYRLERELTTQALLAGAVDTLDNDAIELPGWLADVEDSPTIAHEILDGLRYRFRYQQWNRFSPLVTPLHRYVVLLTRFHGKLLKRKKTFSTGVTLAVKGVDHSVSTDQILVLIQRWMDKHFSVRTVRINQHHGALASLIACLPADQSLPDATHAKTALPLRRVMQLAWEAWRWREQVRQSVRLSTAGFVVIWNPDEVVQARRALSVVYDASSELPRFKQYLLQSCVASLEIEPQSDARFLVTSSCGNDLTGSGAIPEELSVVSVARGPSESVATVQKGKSTGMSDKSAIGESSEMQSPEECSNLKIALWETVAGLQY